MSLVVGFDLDLTLVDSRPSVVAVAEVLAAEEGRPIDGQLWASRLGPPLEQELAHWVPAEDVERVAWRYRALMAEIGVPRSVLLPYAAESVSAVRELGGQVVVVTAKQETLARLTLDYVGIVVDHVVGWVWREAKGVALRELGATIYVGDHPHDVDGARAAGAVSVGVRTGGSEPLEADVLMDDLTTFPAWLEQHVRQEQSA